MRHWRRDGQVDHTDGTKQTGADTWKAVEPIHLEFAVQCQYPDAPNIELAQRVRGRKNREDLSPLPLAAPYIHDRYGWGATYGVQTNRLLFSHRGQ